MPNTSELIIEVLQKAPNITKSDLIKYFAVLNDNNKALLPSNTVFTIDEKLVNDASLAISECPNYKDILNTTTNVGIMTTWLFFFSIDVDFTTREGEHVVTKLYKFIPYMNKPLDAGAMGKYNNLVASLFIDNKIGVNTIREYVDRTQWMGYTAAIFTIPSLDNKTLNAPPEVVKLKNKLFKENKAAIESNDVVVFSKLEKEILSAADKALNENGATGKMIYQSGFNGNWNNNYKVTSLFRGIVPKSDDFTQFNIATSNLKDGVDKKDIAIHADIGVSAGGGRAKDTQKGGYLTKIFNAAFGGIMADEEGTDCGSTLTDTVTITEKNADNYKYRFIIDKGEFVMLSPDVVKKYIGKTVNMRSPLYCHSTKICHRCLGDMVYRLRIKNIGLHIARISAAIMNKSMKSNLLHLYSNI